MKRSFFKTALALLLCMATVLLPSVNAFASDLQSIVLTESGSVFGALQESENEVAVKTHSEVNDTEETDVPVITNDGVPISVRFEVSPSSANVFVTENKSKQRIIPSSEIFTLEQGKSYTVIAAGNGYVGQSIEYIASADETVTISLAKAAEGSFKQLIAEWSSFRYDKNNNGVINAKTPVTGNDAVLYWAKKIGEGYSTGAASSPIIVDGYIYCYSGTNIYKVDKITGEIVASAKMVGNSSFAIVPPTYANGMLFVGLSNGRVQAFNADTLESLWIYKDSLGGQPNCPITYDDGYIYTGFWRSETREASYVCIPVTDEDPENETEAKLPSWTYTKKGGFYWAEAYISEQYLFIGTDDELGSYTKGYASLLSIDKKSGELADSVVMPFTGDIRCCIVHNNGSLYFTSKGGYFYSVDINEANGDILESTLRYIKLDNYHDSEKAPPMSTSTPTVYNGRAYIGVSGLSQFGMYSGHNITVIDINEWKIAYSVPTQGYPQTSAVLTTAYDEGDGSVYIYMFDNFTPGKMRVLHDCPGATAPVNGTVEEQYFNPNTGITEYYQTAQVLFTPYDAQAQYCICTPVVDSDGFIYFKNDSAYLMMLGSKIEKIQVTKNPDKTSYKVGEVFDPTGMEVIAYYENGAQKDITDYVVWSEEPLTTDDTLFQIRFENVMYQDKDGVAGTTVAPSYATIRLSVTGETASGLTIIELIEETEKRKGLTSFTDTVKFNKDDDVMFVNKATGGTFYIAVLSDMEMSDVKVETTGMITGELLSFDPEKYKSVGELYSVYDKRLENSGEDPVVAKDLTYTEAKKLATERNINGKTTLNSVKCQSFVYVAKLKADQNYTTAFKSGTYRIIAKHKGDSYTTGTVTVVSDVSIFNYEYVKCCGDYDDEALTVGSYDGYSDYLTAKHGYSYEQAYKAQTATVVSSTAFRAIAGKSLTVTCGENVTVNIPSISKKQRGVNFIYNCPEVKQPDANAVTKKQSTFALTFYGNQTIESDYQIVWELGCTYADLLNIYKVKVEEQDVVTYYIYNNGKYFDKIEVDYMTADYTKDVVVTLNGEAGTPLGNYTISVTPLPETNTSSEINPNTGAFAAFAN